MRGHLHCGMTLRKGSLLTTTNILLGLMFAVAATLQVNDIDAATYHNPSQWDVWSWVLFYGLIAGLFLASICCRVSRILLGIAAAYCVVQMARAAPGLYENLFQTEDFTITGSSMSPSHSEVELSREFFGGLIALAGVVFLWWQTRSPERARVDRE